MSDDPRCGRCGHPRSNHPYRHPFVGPSWGDTITAQSTRIEELEAKLAKAVITLKLLADVSVMMQSSTSHDRFKHNTIITDSIWSQWSKQLKCARTTLAELKGQNDE